MKQIAFASALIMLIPVSLMASGANTKTGIGDKNGPECAPGFYYDTTDKLCIAANWI